MTGAVSPNPSAHHNSHLNNHLHPSHHQQSQSAVCEYFRASKIHPFTIFSTKMQQQLMFVFTLQHLLGTVAGIVNKKEPVDELPQRNLRVVIPSASSNSVTAQSAHITNNNHARNSGGEEVSNNLCVKTLQCTNNVYFQHLCS